MKFDKNKVIIPILGLALVGTSTVALSKINRVSNAEKGAEANMSIVTEKETSKQDVAEQETTTIEPATTKPTATKKPIDDVSTSNSDVTTTAPIALKKIALNQTLSDNSGNIIVLKEAIINENEFITITFKTITSKTTASMITSHHHRPIDGYDISFVSNDGTKMGKPNGYGTKYLCGSDCSAMLSHDSSITSITATYTFDDGTVASTVLNLQ